MSGKYSIQCLQEVSTQLPEVGTDISAKIAGWQVTGPGGDASGSFVLRATVFWVVKEGQKGSQPVGMFPLETHPSLKYESTCDGQGAWTGRGGGFESLWEELHFNTKSKIGRYAGSVGSMVMNS